MEFSKIMKALFVVGDGFEDLELFTTAAILRKTMTVTIASISATTIASASAVKITADKRLGEIATSEYSLLLLPTFEGMETSQKLVSLIQEFDKENKIIIAMSRAPLLLAKAGVLENKIATIYPGFESRIPRPRDAKIVIDKNIITSRSPSDTQELALKLVEILQGKAVAKKIWEKMTG